jgi:hypothetical protein
MSTTTDTAAANEAGLGAAGEGGYDAAFIFEALHDMASPVEALAAIRDLLAADGAPIVADEKVADTFTAPGDEVERSTTASASGTACRPAGPRPRRWPPAPSCARPRRASGRARPVSPASRCCPSTTCSGASTG